MTLFLTASLIYLLSAFTSFSLDKLYHDAFLPLPEVLTCEAIDPKLWTVKQLKAVAVAIGAVIPSKMKKDEIISLLSH